MSIIVAKQKLTVVVGEERFLLVDFTDALDANQTQYLGSATVAEVGGSALGAMSASVNAGTPVINGRTVAANTSMTISQDDSTAIDFSSATAGQVYVLLVTATTVSPIEVLIAGLEIEVVGTPC